jgi:hypothetical protein
MGADRLNEAVRRNSRLVGIPAGRSPQLALFILVAAFLALGPTARPQGEVPPPAGPAVSDSLSRGRVDDLLEAWSDLYLSAWSDSLALAPSDSLAATGSASESTPVPGSRTGALAVVSAGCALEGLDESFGQESLVSLSTTEHAQTETPASGSDTLDVPAVRFAERTTAWLGVLGLQARTGAAAAHDAGVTIETKIGATRADVAAEIFAAPRRGAGRDVTVRNLFLWDRADDGTTSHQDLLFLRWRPPLAARGWQLDLVGSFDVSRSGDVDIELEPGGGVAADSILRLTYLNYEKYGLRLELWRRSLLGSSLAVDFSRKQVRQGGSGSYSLGTLSANQTWLLMGGSFNLDLDVRRRHYDDPISALGSSWESEVWARWLGAGARRHLDAQLRALATLHDDPVSLDENNLLAFAGDQLIVKSEVLVRFPVVGVRDLPTAGSLGAGGPGWEWEVGVGPVAQLIRTRGGDGDASALGARVETEMRSIRGPSAWWIDGSVELGWREYRDQQLDDRLTFEGFTLSLAQSNYRYGQVSVIGGGGLPWSLAWEGCVSLDQEWHALAEDDARLVSVSLTFKRLWVLWGRGRESLARLH